MAEYYVQDEEHQKGLQKRPEEPEDRVLVSELEVAPGKPQDEISVSIYISKVGRRDQFLTSNQVYCPVAQRPECSSSNGFLRHSNR